MWCGLLLRGDCKYLPFVGCYCVLFMVAFRVPVVVCSASRVVCVYVLFDVVRCVLLVACVIYVCSLFCGCSLCVVCCLSCVVCRVVFCFLFCVFRCSELFGVC